MTNRNNEMQSPFRKHFLAPVVILPLTFAGFAGLYALMGREIDLFEIFVNASIMSVTYLVMGFMDYRHDLKKQKSEKSRKVD